MSRDLILKKLEQMKILLSELGTLVELPYEEFKNSFTNIRSAERNFQLIIELASDINTHIIAESGKETPDTYRQSFKQMASLKILKENALPDFTKSSNLRNILVHEYDFDEDNFIFYKSAKKFIPLYEDYMDSIKNYLASK
ncbi:MAG TPA: DUF86 domain-containing protein [Candidatus Paceibacterota bacterium]